MQPELFLPLEFSYANAWVLGKAFIALSLTAFSFAFFKRLRKKGAWSLNQAVSSLFRDGQLLQPPIKVFFGQQAKVQDKWNRYALLTVLSGEMASEGGLRERLATFQALVASQISGLAPLLEVKIAEVTQVAYGNLIDEQGKSLQPISLALKKPLPRFEAEMLLFSLAQTMRALHQIAGANKERLYHGFLQPSNLYIQEEGGMVKGMIVADGGLAFAVGPKAVYRRFIALQDKPFLLNQGSYNTPDSNHDLFYLAPEQKELSQLSLVGQPADFFSFGAIATFLFTKQPFVSAALVDWSLVSSHWQPFLRKCLSAQPFERPQDFAQLDEELFDPTWYLRNEGFNTGEIVKETKFLPIERGELTREAIMPLLEKVQKRTQGSSYETAEFFDIQQAQVKELLKLAAIHRERAQWKEAIEVLQLIRKNAPSIAEPYAYLALCYFHLNHLELAAIHYQKACELNPDQTDSILKGTSFPL